MNLYQPTAATFPLLPRSLDYAAAGLKWSSGFNCYIRSLGDYWLAVYPSSTPGTTLAKAFLTCDENVLMRVSLRDNAGLKRAVSRAQEVIRGIAEQAACEDLNELTERLGMGRLFDEMALA